MPRDFPEHNEPGLSAAFNQGMPPGLAEQLAAEQKAEELNQIDCAEHPDDYLLPTSEEEAEAAYERHMHQEPEPMTLKCDQCGRESCIVTSKVVNQRQDPTEVYKLECGHWVM